MPDTTMPPTNLEELEQKFERLTATLSTLEITSDPPALAKAAKERSALAPVVDAYRELKRLGCMSQFGPGKLRRIDRLRLSRSEWRVAEEVIGGGQRRMEPNPSRRGRRPCDLLRR